MEITRTAEEEKQLVAELKQTLLMQEIERTGKDMTMTEFEYLLMMKAKGDPQRNIMTAYIHRDLDDSIPYRTADKLEFKHEPGPTVFQILDAIGKNNFIYDETTGIFQFKKGEGIPFEDLQIFSRVTDFLDIIFWQIEY